MVHARISGISINVPCEDASAGRRLNQLRSIAIWSSLIGMLNSRPRPLRDQRAPRPSKGCGGPVMPSRARIAAQTPHFIASALRTPFHIDSAPTPLLSATCGVSAIDSAFASRSSSSFISLPAAIAAATDSPPAGADLIS